MTWLTLDVTHDHRYGPFVVVRYRPFPFNDVSPVIYE